jgi:hypothetical protein
MVIIQSYTPFEFVNFHKTGDSTPQYADQLVPHVQNVYYVLVPHV